MICHDTAVSILILHLLVGRSGTPVPTGVMPILHFAFLFVSGGQTPPLRGCINFAFCVFVRFGRANPSPTGVHQFCILRFRSFWEGRPLPCEGASILQFCVFVRFGRADPSPTRVHQFCILRFRSFREGKPIPYEGASILILHFAFCVCLGGRSRTPVPTGVMPILHFAFSFVSGGQTPSLRGCGNFAFCISQNLFLKF